MKLVPVFAAVLAILACITVAQAMPIPVTNSGFETPVPTDGNYTNGAVDPVPGWVVQSGAGTNSIGVRNWQNGQFPGTTGLPGTMPAPADGLLSLYVNSFSYIQTLTDTLQAGVTYDLTVAIGCRMDTRTAISDGMIRLMAGNTVIAENITINPQSVASGTFADFTVSYTSPAGDPLAGQPLKIQVGRNSTVQISSYLCIDNVRLEATPEPATMALLGVGALALIRRRR